MHRVSFSNVAKFCKMVELRCMFKLGRLNILVINSTKEQVADELRDN